MIFFNQFPNNGVLIPPLADVFSDEYNDDYLISAGLLIKGSGCRNWICKTCRKEDVKSKIVRHIQTKEPFKNDVRDCLNSTSICLQMKPCSTYPELRRFS